MNADPIIRSGQTIWREGDRIRRTDGTGYADRVSDEMIERHLEDHQLDPADGLFVLFAEAVLALRKFERASLLTELQDEKEHSDG